MLLHIQFMRKMAAYCVNERGSANAPGLDYCKLLHCPERIFGLLREIRSHIFWSMLCAAALSLPDRRLAGQQVSDLQKVFCDSGKLPGPKPHVNAV